MLLLPSIFLPHFPRQILGRNLRPNDTFNQFLFCINFYFKAQWNAKTKKINFRNFGDALFVFCDYYFFSKKKITIIKKKQKDQDAKKITMAKKNDDYFFFRNGKNWTRQDHQYKIHQGVILKTFHSSHFCLFRAWPFSCMLNLHNNDCCGGMDSINNSFQFFYITTREGNKFNPKCVFPSHSWKFSEYQKRIFLYIFMCSVLPLARTFHRDRPVVSM